MDQLQALRFFVKLGETLSFKMTAEHFRVPPSTVSRSIRALEDNLGTTLVERTTRQVKLTETGDWYRSEVMGPLRALAAADELAEDHADTAAGTVRLTALPGYGEIKLFPALAKFRSAYPRIVCDVELTDRSLDLATGEIDVAVRATASPPDYLVAKRLHSHRYMLVAAPSYLSRRGRPRVLTDIDRHDALGYRLPSGVGSWMAVRPGGELVPVAMNLRLVTNHGLMLRDAAIAGEGLAFLPHWGVRAQLEEGLLEEVVLEDAKVVKSSGPSPDIVLLHHPKKARLGKVRALVDFLHQELAEP